MNIKFKSIDIQNFRSIDKASVILENQGTVIVKGINEYEDKATSNGSGKSSVFEAIIFALFEETSSGEKDVANRIIGDGYNIVLKLNIDGIDYTITRECKGNKTNVVFYKNDVDISARNKTDTNKLIVSTLGINKNIFLDSVFLSQTVSTNLASLSPTARKERLEILTNTDTTIANFKEQLKQVQNNYEAKCVETQMNQNKLRGKLDTLEQQKQDIQLKIDEVNKQIERRNALGNIEDIETEIQDVEDSLKILNDSLTKKEQTITSKENEIEDFRKTGEDNLTQKDNINKELTEKRQEYSDLQNSFTLVHNKIDSAQNEILRLETEITKIENSDTCPTCGRKYDNVNEEHIKNTINELMEQINKQKEIIEKQNKEASKISLDMETKQTEGIKQKEILEDIEQKIQEHKNTLNNLERERKTLITERQQITINIQTQQSNISMLRDKKEQILKIEVGNKTEFETMLKEIETEINEVNKQIEEQTNEYTTYDNYVSTVKHSIQLVTKEFRTYLLQNSLTYLNNLLEKYSTELFSNTGDVIKIEGNDTKLDIKLGNATYESLSGGERTRVNIALLLAQKSLANIIGNISCNIIILDEILGYCDSQAETNVIDLITKELDSLESIYMVSHKEIPIGYDTQMVVTKNVEGLSKVRCY